MVVTLERTLLFQTAFVSSTIVEKLAESGISLSTLLQAWAEETNEIPILETSDVWSNERTTPIHAPSD